MRYEPCGFHVLIEVEVVENQIKEGALKDFVLSTDDQHRREQGGNDVGKVVSFGPTCYKGYEGCEKPADWHPDLIPGAKVEFNRYDGKQLRLDKDGNVLPGDKPGPYRVINDSDIIMVIKDE